MTKVTSQAQSKGDNGTAEKMSLQTTARKLAGTLRTWRGVVVRPRDEQRRLGKLGCRQSTTAYIRRTISDDDDGDSVKRWLRASWSEDRRNFPARHDGVSFPCKYLKEARVTFLCHFRHGHGSIFINPTQPIKLVL